MAGGKIWTEEDIQYLREYAAEGRSQAETAELLDRTAGSVAVRACKLKIKFKGIGYAWTVEATDTLRELAGTMSIEQLANELQVSVTNIRDKCLNSKISYAYKTVRRDTARYKLDVEKSLIVLDEFVGARTHIRHQCIECGNIWLARPDHILAGSGCIKCNKRGSIPNPNTLNNLYFLEIVAIDETFLKVGISVNPTSRVAGIKTDIGSSNIKSITILDSISSKGSYVFKHEQAIHSNNDLVKHAPKIHFAGHTECYDVCSKDSLIDIFSKLKQEAL